MKLCHLIIPIIKKNFYNLLEQNQCTQTGRSGKKKSFLEKWHEITNYLQQKKITENALYIYSHRRRLQLPPALFKSILAQLRSRRQYFRLDR